ncbi:MAG: hypothetical protein LC796_09025 [Acidobacteria bacterium]|nr:hypothetical protein [Acidobacteriota bacterium]MCA1612006.1 hypothetical protein [Acidobacteriota bacterium]
MRRPLRIAFQCPVCHVTEVLKVEADGIDKSGVEIETVCINEHRVRFVAFEDRIVFLPDVPKPPPTSPR